MRKDIYQWVIPLVLAAGLVAALWYYRSLSGREVQPPAPLPEQPAALPETTPPAGPLHPLQETGDAAASQPDLRPLPPLDQSDDYFKLALTDLFGEALAPLLGDSQLIERTAVTVDNLPRSELAQRMRPLTGVDGRFLVEPRDDESKFMLDPANYRRYDTLVAMVAASDMADVADVYRRFYPLLQTAYVNLGYPHGYFNDRVIEVIDHLLATPDVTDPPTLVRPNVLYEYADPALEKLSSGQKLLIRIGPEHRKTIEAKLVELRRLIL